MVRCCFCCHKICSPFSSFAKTFSFGNSLLLGITVPIALVLQDCKWSKSLGFKNHPSIYTVCPSFLFVNRARPQHRTHCYTVCWWGVFQHILLCWTCNTSGLQRWNIYAPYLWSFPFMYTWKNICLQRHRLLHQWWELLQVYICFEMLAPDCLETG